MEGMGTDGRVEDGGLLAGSGRLVMGRFGQNRDGMLRRLNGGRLQQLAGRPWGTLALLDHKLLLVLLNQRVGLNRSVSCNENKTNLSNLCCDTNS